jgi:hypothetical protein
MRVVGLRNLPIDFSFKENAEVERDGSVEELYGGNVSVSTISMSTGSGWALGIRACSLASIFKR